MKVIINQRNKRTGEILELNSILVRNFQDIVPVARVSKERRLISTGLRITSKRGDERTYYGDSFYDICVTIE